MEMQKYIYDNSFLPNEGRVFVDTCGPKWMPDSYGYVGEISRLKDFNVKLEGRGNVFTTPMILEEIAGNVRHYLDCMEIAEVWLKERVDKYGENANISPLEDKIAVNFQGAFGHAKLYDFLEVVNIPKEISFGRLNYFEIRDFYDGFDIQEPDKELVAAATFFGSGSGILTADGRVMGAFRRGLFKFCLDGFIGNSIECKTDWVWGKERSCSSFG